MVRRIAPLVVAGLLVFAACGSESKSERAQRTAEELREDTQE